METCLAQQQVDHLRYIELADEAQVTLQTWPRLYIAPTLLDTSEQHLREFAHYFLLVVCQDYVLLSLPHVTHGGMPGEGGMHRQLAELFPQVANQQPVHAQALAKA